MSNENGKCDGIFLAAGPALLCAPQREVARLHRPRRRQRRHRPEHERRRLGHAQRRHLERAFICRAFGSNCRSAPTGSRPAQKSHGPAKRKCWPEFCSSDFPTGRASKFATGSLRAAAARTRLQPHAEQKLLEFHRRPAYPSARRRLVSQSLGVRPLQFGPSQTALKSPPFVPLPPSFPFAPQVPLRMSAKSSTAVHHEPARARNAGPRVEFAPQRSNSAGITSLLAQLVRLPGVSRGARRAFFSCGFDRWPRQISTGCSQSFLGRPRTADSASRQPLQSSAAGVAQVFCLLPHRRQ